MHEIKEAAVFEVLLSDGWHKPIEGSFKLDRFAIKSRMSGDIPLWRQHGDLERIRRSRNDVHIRDCCAFVIGHSHQRESLLAFANACEIRRSLRRRLQ